jgi:hypothetical protein
MFTIQNKHREIIIFILFSFILFYKIKDKDYISMIALSLITVFIIQNFSKGLVEGQEVAVAEGEDVATEGEEGTPSNQGVIDDIVVLKNQLESGLVNYTYNEENIQCPSELVDGVCPDDKFFYIRITNPGKGYTEEENVIWHIRQNFWSSLIENDASNPELNRQIAQYFSDNNNGWLTSSVKENDGIKNISLENFNYVFFGDTVPVIEILAPLPGEGEKVKAEAVFMTPDTWIEAFESAKDLMMDDNTEDAYVIFRKLKQDINNSSLFPSVQKYNYFRNYLSCPESVSEAPFELEEQTENQCPRVRTLEEYTNERNFLESLKLTYAEQMQTMDITLPSLQELAPGFSFYTSSYLEDLDFYLEIINGSNDANTNSVSGIRRLKEVVALQEDPEYQEMDEEKKNLQLKYNVNDVPSSNVVEEDTEIKQRPTLTNKTEIKTYNDTVRIGAYDGLCLSSLKNNTNYKLISNNQLSTYMGVQFPPEQTKTDDDQLYGPSIDGDVKSPQKMMILSNNKVSLNCCGDSPFMTSNGCVCLSNKQKRFLYSRGNNAGSSQLSVNERLLEEKSETPTRMNEVVMNDDEMLLENPNNPTDTN